MLVLCVVSSEGGVCPKGGGGMGHPWQLHRHPVEQVDFSGEWLDLSK